VRLALLVVVLVGCGSVTTSQLATDGATADVQSTEAAAGSVGSGGAGGELGGRGGAGDIAGQGGAAAGGRGGAGDVAGQGGAAAGGRGGAGGASYPPCEGQPPVSEIMCSTTCVVCYYSDLHTPAPGSCTARLYGGGTYLCAPVPSPTALRGSCALCP